MLPLYKCLKKHLFEFLFTYVFLKFKGKGRIFLIKTSTWIKNTNFVLTMARLLLIESSEHTCSVALSENGHITAIREQANCPSVVAVITLMMEACIHETGWPLHTLDAVAVSAGPGSYTALRTGVAAAKGMCYALDIPLIGINTLDALAWGCQMECGEHPDHIYIPMLDARRDEVWLAAYNGVMELIAAAQPLNLVDGALDQWLEKIVPDVGRKKILVSGSGKMKDNGSDIINNSDICRVEHGSARFLLPLAEKYYVNKVFEQVASFDPIYMKPPNITISKKLIL